MMGDMERSEQELAVLAVALFSHPDLQDLDALDARWYVDETQPIRPRFSHAELRAMRWQLLHAQMDPILARIGEQLRAMAEALRPVLAQLNEAFRRMREAFVEAGVVPTQAPSEPKARALHMVRHRNTGPQVHADPRRNGRRNRR